MGDLQVMSASMDSDPDIALSREDLVILKRDVASLIEHIKGGATNNVQNATNQVEPHVGSLRQEAGAQGERSAQAVRVFTEKQPLVALIIAVGIGYVGARGCCQTKSPQRLVVVASVHEQPVPLFQ